MLFILILVQIVLGSLVHAAKSRTPDKLRTRTGRGPVNFAHVALGGAIVVIGWVQVYTGTMFSAPHVLRLAYRLLTIRPDAGMARGIGHRPRQQRVQDRLGGAGRGVLRLVYRRTCLAASGADQEGKTAVSREQVELLNHLLNAMCDDKLALPA